MWMSASGFVAWLLTQYARVGWQCNDVSIVKNQNLVRFPIAPLVPASV